MSGRLVTAGRVAHRSTPSRNRDQFIVGDLLERSPDTAMRVEAAAHAKARAIVTIRIGLRPGNNTDVLEALGLIPKAVTL